MRGIGFLLAAASAAAMVACTKTESTSVLTRGVGAELNVTADESGTTIAHGRLYVGEVGSGNFLDLQGDDALFASTGGRNLRMTKGELLSQIRYRTEFTGADRENTPFTISLRRTVDSGAENSTCALPAPYAASAQTPKVAVSSQDLVITWSPSGTNDRMRWSVVGNCIVDAGAAISGDPGTLTIPRGSLKQLDPAKPQACDITVQISRERVGQLDPAYGKGGSMVCAQTRSVKVATTP